MKLKINTFKMVLAVTVVVSLLYVIGSFGPGDGRSHQGKVIRAVVTLDHGSFEVQLTTNSNITGQRDWVPPGRTYTGTYSQDVLVDQNERVQFWLTAATNIDREAEKRTLTCQLYENGKTLEGPARDRRVVRQGEPGEPASCTYLAIG